MLRLLNSALILLCAIINMSCGFIDLRQIGINIEPSVTDYVLPEADSPVIVSFDTEMIKKDTESILQISSDSGAVTGDKFWRGNDLYFVPVQGWTAGVRYTLSIMGTARSADGRDLRLQYLDSFYAINKNAPPFLEYFNPLNGASTSTNDIVLEFIFSRSMDRLSVESALIIDGIGSKTFKWSDDNKKLNVIPDKQLSPWIVYRWNLRESAKGIDGVPLPKTYHGYFKTDIDKMLPEVKRIFPVLNADNIWYPTGAGFETGLGIGHGIAVEFSKKIGESALRSIRFEPSLSGRIEFLSDSSIVYIFSKTPDPGTTYTMTVSGDTKDIEGIKIGSDYKINFTPDIPVLNIISFAIGGTTYNIDSVTDNIFPVYTDPAAGPVSISIHFSLMFSNEEKKNAPWRITLNPFFPRTLAPVALQYASWISGDRLFMRWEGLVRGNGEAPNYYTLKIPGGRGGISSDSGIYMNDDLVIYLEIKSASALEEVK